MPRPIVGMELSEIQEALGPDPPAYRARQVESAERILTLPAVLRARLAAHPCWIRKPRGRDLYAARAQLRRM